MTGSNNVEPCCVCKNDCLENQDSICCNICNNWTHLKCSNLNRRRFNYLCKSDAPYYCINCCSNVTCPCCEKDCTVTQNSINCSCCNRWIHLNCTSLSIEQFQNLSKPDLDYNCNYCLYPFSTVESNDLFVLFNNKSTSLTPNNLNPNSDCEYGDEKCISPHEIKNLASIYRNGLSVLSLNIRSLNKNIDRLEIILNEADFTPDVVCITETWINDKKPFLYSLKGYSFVNQPCPGRAGGSGIFIKNGIQFNIIKQFQFNLEHCDDIWVELFLSKSLKFIVSSIYRHPSYNFHNFQKNS